MDTNSQYTPLDTEEMDTDYNPDYKDPPHLQSPDSYPRLLLLISRPLPLLVHSMRVHNHEPCDLSQCSYTKYNPS